MTRCLFPLVIAAFLSSDGVNAQLAADFTPPRSNCCLLNAAKSLADQLQDWNQVGCYHQANQELKKQQGNPRRVVFLGDSITDFWKLDEYFPEKPYVNRGMAGINDVASNTGPSTAEMIQQNIMVMTELAQHHGIKVILCSLLPVSDYPFLRQQKGESLPAPPRGPFPGLGPFPRMKMTETHPPSDILKLNAWIQECANRVNAAYGDYFTALVDEKGWLKDPDSADGLHPNADGYKLMAPIAAAAIEKAFQ